MAESNHRETVSRQLMLFKFSDEVAYFPTEPPPSINNTVHLVHHRCFISYLLINSFSKPLFNSTVHTVRSRIMYSLLRIQIQPQFLQKIVIKMFKKSYSKHLCRRNYFTVNVSRKGYPKRKEKYSPILLLQVYMYSSGQVQARIEFVKSDSDPQHSHIQYISYSTVTLPTFRVVIVRVASCCQ